MLTQEQIDTLNHLMTIAPAGTRWNSFGVISCIMGHCINPDGEVACMAHDERDDVPHRLMPKWFDYATRLPDAPWRNVEPADTSGMVA